MTNIQEIWKPIKNYEGLYEVSNLGRVKSLQRIVYGGGIVPKKTISEKILKQSTNSCGYKTVLLSKGGVSKLFSVARCVGKAFLNLDNGVINHKSGIKTDNTLVNLEISTVSENNLHATENMLKRKKTILINGIVIDRVITVEKEGVHSNYKYISEVARLFNLNRRTLSASLYRNDFILTDCNHKIYLNKTI